MKLVKCPNLETINMKIRPSHKNVDFARHERNVRSIHSRKIKRDKRKNKFHLSSLDRMDRDISDKILSCYQEERKTEAFPIPKIFSCVTSEK